MVRLQKECLDSTYLNLEKLFVGTISFVSKNKYQSNWSTTIFCTVSKPLRKDKSKNMLKRKKDQINLCTSWKNRVTLHIENETLVRDDLLDDDGDDDDNALCKDIDDFKF